MATETEAVVVRMVGAGGVVWDLDLPAVGTVQREIFDEKVAKGELAFADGVDVRDSEAAATPETPGTTDGVPHGTIPEIIDWVRGAPEGEPPTDGWEDRARGALADEQSKAKPRETLVEKLEDIVAAATPETPGT